MQIVRLKDTDLAPSRLCIGGCPAGEYGWGDVSREQVICAMRRAVELGVTFFDTADTYGLGRSEETLGEALRGLRENVVIATKFGMRVENGHTRVDNSPAYIRRALAASLKRLRTDRVDLYQVHNLDGVTPVPDMMETLISLKRAGDIRAIGLSNITESDLPAFEPYRAEIATFQNHFSLAHRADEASLRRIAQALEAAPMTWGSLGQGILTGKYGADVHFEANDRRSRAVYDNFYGEKLTHNLRVVEVMRPIARTHGVAVASVAVRWILDVLPDSVVLTGVKSPEQAEQNALALGFRLTDEELRLLNEASA